MYLGTRLKLAQVRYVNATTIDAFIQHITAPPLTEAQGCYHSDVMMHLKYAMESY